MAYYLEQHPNRPGHPAQFGYTRRNGGWLSGVIGVHTTENLTDYFGPDYNAENVASFISQRPDYGSYHCVADYDSIVHLAHPRWEAWADTTNNPHAMSVSGSLQAHTWLALTLERRRKIVSNMALAAAQMVKEAVRSGLLASPTPARRISAAEAISGSKAGFYGHGETNPLTRSDPGSNFDWDYFLSEYARFIGGAVSAASIEEDDLPYSEWPEKDKQEMIKDFWNYRNPDKKISGGKDAYWWLLHPGHNVWKTRLKSATNGKLYQAASFMINNNKNGWMIPGLKSLLEKLAAKTGVSKADLDAAVVEINENTDSAMADVIVDSVEFDVTATIKQSEEAPK